MPRPRKCRMVGTGPTVTLFKPCGIPFRDLIEVYLTMEGLEALRLSDLEGLKQEEAAERMGVSRQTFGRILAQARKTISEAVVLGRALNVGGGVFRIPESAPPMCPVEASPPPISSIKELHMNKIAITSDGPDLDNLLDPRFGRAAGFIVIDPETEEFTYVDNGASQAMSQGAGIQAAETIARSGATTLLTGYVGPKAFKALSAAGITVIQNLENLTVRQAVARFKTGDLAPASEPNKPEHW